MFGACFLVVLHWFQFHFSTFKLIMLFIAFSTRLDLASEKIISIGFLLLKKKTKSSGIAAASKQCLCIWKFGMKEKNTKTQCVILNVFTDLIQHLDSEPTVICCLIITFSFVTFGYWDMQLLENDILYAISTLN